MSSSPTLILAGLLLLHFNDSENDMVKIATLSYVLVPGTMSLSPLLIPGELCLGGHQLARGYLNRNEKTRAVFLDNPFAPGKLYRTGDCVISHEDGSIEMVGRLGKGILGQNSRSLLKQYLRKAG